MLVFTGTHINKVDRKGRVSVPAPFRAALTKAGASEIAVFPSYNSKALEGCGPDIMASLADDTFANYSFYASDPNNLATQIFEITRQLEWDAEGRIGLPEEMMAHAGIAEQAAFVGKGRFFQVWSPEGLAAQRSADAALIAQNPPRLILRRPEGP
jgi:MraZ protein